VRYLVTGGAGFIGSHLVDALASRGDEVMILDDLSTGSRQNVQHLVESGGVELVEGSVLDGRLVDDCVQSVDRCFHLASAVGVQLVIDKPLDTLLANVNGTQNVMSAAARHDRWLLYTSTSEVYGKQDRTPLTEDSDCHLGPPVMSRWSYAIAKAFGEAMGHTLHSAHGAPVVVTRLFNVVGPRQTDRYGMVLPTFVRQALTGQDLTVFGNGTQMRCFLHVSDAVHALLLLADAEGCTGRVFNVGSTEEVAVIALAGRVIERTRSSSTIRLVPYAEAYGPGFEELGRRRPDTGQVKAFTGWQPSRTLDEAIDEVAAYERSLAEQDKSLRLVG
jgi:nucleoside-diphosphate-sugar epimerase